MKATKRSLIVSIAILCVCAMSLTAASYAWFSASTKAEVTNIGLTVDKASDLQISLDGENWGYSLDAALSKKLVDLSTADAVNFVEPMDREEVQYDGKLPSTNSGYKTGTGYVDLTVYFRSANDGSTKKVTMAGDTFDNTKAIAPAMRVASVAVSETKTVFFANTAGTDDVIAKADGTAGSVTLNAIGTPTEIITLNTNVNNGITGQDTTTYVYGEITVRYWIEGTADETINDNSGVSFNHIVNFALV